VANDHVLLSFRQTEHKPDEIKQAYERTLHSIQEYLQWISNDVRAYNDSLPRLATAIDAIWADDC
jgi:hypothetical protein